MLKYLREQPFNLKGAGGGGGVMVFCTDLKFFLNTWAHFYFFFNYNQTKLFFFLPSQNNTLKPD